MQLTSASAQSITHDHVHEGMRFYGWLVNETYHCYPTACIRRQFHELCLNHWTRDADGLIGLIVLYVQTIG